MRNKYIIYASWYFFMFFAIGAFLPLFSQFLNFRSFTGLELGLTFSLGSLATIIMQPIWGYISDKFKNPKQIIFFITLAACIAAFMISINTKIIFIIIFYIMFQAFFSGIGPLSDSIVLGSSFEFGKIRLWGAIGFAVGVQVAGLLAEVFGLRVIFLILILSYLITILILKKVEVVKLEEHSVNKNDILLLFKNLDFVIFLIAAFMISGTITAHNNYFGILYRELGGTIAGIGLAFLLFAGSEAPIMSLSQNIAKKVNLSLALFISSLIYNIRWYWYGTGPNPNWILILFLLQGLSIGSYLVFSVLFIRENTQPKLRTTAIAIFTSFSTGVGGMCIQYISGLIKERSDIMAVYTFYSYATVLASFLFLFLYIKNTRAKIKTI